VQGQLWEAADKPPVPIAMKVVKSGDDEKVVAESALWGGLDHQSIVKCVLQVLTASFIQAQLNTWIHARATDAYSYPQTQTEVKTW